MPVRVVWTNGEPADREEWEDILRAEYGTAMGEIAFHLEQTPQGVRLTRVEEEDLAGTGPRRLDQRQRFVTALVAAGKPVDVEEELRSSAGEGEELEPVSLETLNERTEQARREGESGE